MPTNNNTWFLFLTSCMLIGLSYAIIGDRVRTAKQGDFPYVVSVSGRATNDHAYGNLHFCTGTLIKTRSILTAAHCLKHKSPSQVEIIAGSVNLMMGKRYFPESWITFDQWKNHTKNRHSYDDIAVIILEGHGIRDIQPVNLLMVSNKYLSNEKIKILGWGNLSNGKQPFHLRGAPVQVISNDECSKLGTQLKGELFIVPPHYFCSKTEPYVLSTCGDGGAPLVNRKHFIVGINIGTCPKVEGTFPPDFLNQNLLNSHLYLIGYKDFLIQASK